MNERVSCVDGKTYAIGFEMLLPQTERNFYWGMEAPTARGRYGAETPVEANQQRTSRALRASALMPATLQSQPQSAAAAPGSIRKRLDYG
jgi:hypothetical protein